MTTTLLSILVLSLILLLRLFDQVEKFLFYIFSEKSFICSIVI
jgi:hypothetical protein